MSDDTTLQRTLWSDTLFELLVVAIDKKSDSQVLEILKEIKQKGYKKAQVMRFCEKRFDAAQMRRLKGIIGQMGGDRN